MPTVHFKLAPVDQQTMAVAVELDGQEVARSHLDAANVDQLIQALGQHRANMLPLHPEQPDLSKTPVLNVQAYGFADHKAEGAPELMVIKHPMFGWLGFTLADDAASDIGRRLQAQAEVGSGSEQSKPN